MTTLAVHQTQLNAYPLPRNFPATKKTDPVLSVITVKDKMHISENRSEALFSVTNNTDQEIVIAYDNERSHSLEYVAARTPYEKLYDFNSSNPLKKITISYLTGKVIKTFTIEEYTALPQEKRHLDIKNYLPLRLTIDNQSSSPLTLQKTLENFLVSNHAIKGSVSVKQETSTINANKKQTYTFSSIISSETRYEFSADLQKTVSFDAKIIYTIREITLSPSSSDYCSSSLFTLDLQDTTNPLLATKVYPDKLTLTVKDAPEGDEDNAFGSSCKKLIFTLTN